MNSLTVFDYNDNQVRTVLIDNEVWFVAKDIANVLDYVNPAKMLNHVDEDDKQVVNPQEFDSSKMEQSFGTQTFKLSIINESGLYACIFGSHKPEAKKFKRWVTSEVLPSIRKTGSYTQEKLSPAEMLLEQAKMFVEHEKRMNAIEQKTTEALTIANEAKEEVAEVRNELSKLKEFAVAQPPGLDQDQADLINKAFQNLGAVLAESGVAKPQCYKEPWKDLGLTMRNSTLNYDLNARISNARKKYEADLEIWNDNIKKWENTPKPRGKKPVKPIKPSRISILIRDNKLSEGFKAAQQVVSAQLAKLSI